MEQKRLLAFSERFSQLRGDRTQGKFADFLGISRPTVGFYENGTRIPDALILRQIAEKCQVSTDWLLGLSDVPNREATIRQICNYTGLEENTVIELNMRKTLNESRIDVILEIVNMIVAEHSLLADLIWKAGISAFEAERDQLKMQTGEVAAKMIANSVSKKKDELDGMILVPAYDASQLYSDAASDLVKSVVKGVIEDYIRDYVDSVTGEVTNEE